MTFGGVRLSGDAARVLAGGRQIGNLYGWRLEGRDGRWTATAVKYRLAEGVAGEVAFRFFLGRLEIEGAGHFFSEVQADGSVHRDAVEARGTHLWIRQTVPSGSS